MYTFKPLMDIVKGLNELAGIWKQKNVSRNTIQKIRVEQISPNPNQARIDFGHKSSSCTWAQIGCTTRGRRRPWWLYSYDIISFRAWRSYDCFCNFVFFVQMDWSNLPALLGSQSVEGYPLKLFRQKVSLTLKAAAKAIIEKMIMAMKPLW